MKTILVKLKETEYQIHIQTGLIERIGSLINKFQHSSKIIVISSHKILRLHGEKLTSSLHQVGISHETIAIRDKEHHKNLSTLQLLYQKLARLRTSRNSLLVALGGGVIGDITGFVAASYLRGIPYIQIPTTLLAQIDSSIGGKTGVNLSTGKNLVGAFYQPQAVFIDPNLLNTLPKKELESGFYESLKFGIISDPKLYELVIIQAIKFSSHQNISLYKIICRSAEIKAFIVTKDERESHARMALNFGHTLGHAIESASAYRKFTHGQAIGHGMILATQIAKQLEKISAGEAEKIQNDISHMAPLPRLSNLRWQSICRHMLSDKKFIDNRLKFILPRKIGKVEIVEDIPLGVIKTIVRNYLRGIS